MNYLQATKFPKTPHFDFSDSLQNDDRKLESISGFEGKRIILTEKLDGENSTIYNDYYHPRSVIDDGHKSRSWLKSYISDFQYKIPENYRVCGEYLFAQHSIKYDSLQSFFYVFSVWNNENKSISWDSLIDMCRELNILHVPVLYDGIFDINKIQDIYKNLDFNKSEGIVCRIADEYHYDEYHKYTAKAVRPNHVSTDEHWKKTWKPNKLSS